MALGLQRQPHISGLALLATPWDFHQPNELRAKSLGAYAQSINSYLENTGKLPTDILQSMFVGMDPMLVMTKFSKFANYTMDSAKARHFVAIEDWLNDGVPLAANVTRDCLIGWYGDNKPVKGEWQVSGQTIDPAKFKIRTLALVPTGDKIVPLKSATALSNALPNAEVLHPPLGHIGMVVGNGARELVWQKLADFFR